MIRADQVEAEQIEWLWKDRIPFGAITILSGDPGLGKSLLTVWLTAQLSKGELGQAGPAGVLLSSGEDPVSQIVRPRLDAAGAVLERVTFVEFQRDGFFTPPTLPDDVPALEKVMEQHEARLLVLDPLAAHLSTRIDSWKDQSIRAALLPLRGLAERTGAAVVVVAHLNKVPGTDPIHRLGGSIGLPATARSVLLLGRDPDDPGGSSGDRRILAHVKSNVGRPAESLSLQIESSGGDGDAARIVPLGSSPYLGSDLLKSEPGGHGSKLSLAKELLVEQLAEGAKPVRDLYGLAADEGISDTTLNRAKAELGIKPKKQDFTGNWLWQLPLSGLAEEGDPKVASEPRLNRDGDAEQPEDEGPPSRRAPF